MKKQTQEELGAQEATSLNQTVQVQTTMITQAGNEILGTPDKILYYLVIKKGDKKRILNIGKATHDMVWKMLNE